MIKRLLKSHIIIAIIGCVMLTFVNPLTVHAAPIGEISASKPGYGMVYTSEGGSLNVRQEPNNSSNIITSLSYASRVMIVGESGNFYKVQYDESGHYGYASKDYLVFMDRNYYLKANISSGNLNMRSGAGTSHGVICGIPRNACFAWVENTSSDWYLGVWGNKSGYTSVQYTARYTY